MKDAKPVRILRKRDALALMEKRLTRLETVVRKQADEIHWLNRQVKTLNGIINP